MSAPPAVLLPILTTMSAWLDFLIAFGLGEMDGDGAGGDADDDVARGLARDDDGGLSRRRHGHQPDLAAEPLCRADTGVRARWMPSLARHDDLAAVPLAVAFYFAGTASTGVWVALGIPVGPGAPVGYEVPALVQ